jgi:hypothetical protein
MDDTVQSKVEVHAEVFVDFTLMYHEVVAIDRFKVLTEFCDLVGVNV